MFETSALNQPSPTTKHFWYHRKAFFHHSTLLRRKKDASTCGEGRGFTACLQTHQPPWFWMREATQAASPNCKQWPEGVTEEQAMKRRGVSCTRQSSLWQLTVTPKEACTPLQDCTHKATGCHPWLQDTIHYGKKGYLWQSYVETDILMCFRHHTF